MHYPAFQFHKDVPSRDIIHQRPAGSQRPDLSRPAAAMSPPQPGCHPLRLCSPEVSTYSGRSSGSKVAPGNLRNRRDLLHSGGPRGSSGWPARPRPPGLCLSPAGRPRPLPPASHASRKSRLRMRTRRLHSGHLPLTPGVSTPLRVLTLYSYEVSYNNVLLGPGLWRSG